MSATPYSHDFTVHPRKLGLDSTCWFNGQSLSRPFSQVLPPNAADLLDLSLSIYAADRSSPRDFKRGNTGQRRINVRVGLRNPDRWTTPEMAASLQEFLYWLSEDEWSFRIDKRQTGRDPEESEASLFSTPPELPVSVSLFSGGLDSLAGLACQTTRDPSGSRILVSGCTHSRLRSRQRSQVQRVRSALNERVPTAGARVWHVAVDFGMHRPEGRREEKGQRTRALVFLALGVTAALQAGADTLWVHENGVGALNLPLNETQLGVDNYRGVHPRSLIMFEALVEAVLDRPIRVRNPFLFHTKAAMCRALLPAGFARRRWRRLSPATASRCAFPASQRTAAVARPVSSAGRPSTLLGWARTTLPPHTGAMCARDGRRSAASTSTVSMQCTAKSIGLNGTLLPVIRGSPS